MADDRNRLTDPVILRAPAHPLRIKLLGLVGLSGTLTARHPLLPPGETEPTAEQRTETPVRSLLADRRTRLFFLGNAISAFGDDAVMFFIFGIFVPLGLQVITVGLHRPPTWLAVLTTERGLFGAMAVFALSLPWFFAGVATLYQKNTPNELLGRVSGAQSLAIQAPQALGNLAGAGLVLAMSYGSLAYLIGAVIALTALYLGTRTGDAKVGRAGETTARSVESI